MPEGTATLLASEIAKKINRHEYTVSQWARRGWVRSYKKNPRVILFDWSEVEDDMRANNLRVGLYPRKARPKITTPT